MKKKHLLLTMLILLFQVAVFAQGRMVKGTVKDAKTNETLPGVSVVVEGTTSGTTTDAKGEFSINVDGTGKKVFSKLLKPGESASIDGAAPFKVRVGNATHVEVLHKGQPFDLTPFVRNNVARIELP